MLRVTIEVNPAGKGEWESIAVAHIANTGTGTALDGIYWAQLSKCGEPTSLAATVEVSDFPRKRRNAWDLLYRVLREAVGDRNPIGD